MIQFAVLLLLFFTSTVLSQQVWYNFFLNYFKITFVCFKKPKYDAATLEKALYKVGSIQELQKLGINSKYVFLTIMKTLFFLSF